jgi:formylglycine-generating enzyme required for sulfatase activity
MRHVVRQEQFVEWANGELMDEVLARRTGAAAWAGLVRVIKRRVGEPGARAEVEALVRRGPAAWADALARLEAATPVGIETKVVAGVELVLVPGGKFVMGSPEGEDGRDMDEGPQHEVELASFWLAKTLVTNAQYGEYLKAKPSVKEPGHWGDRRYNQPEQPVVGVSWEEARAYCEWAGLKLPTEAQWEYACRAGTTTRYWSGDSEKDLARVGWYVGNSEGRLRVVGELEPNAFGLYDMHGNVYEWCEDAFGGYETRPRAGDGLRHEPVGDAARVFRGGSFRFVARLARSAYRYGDGPGVRWSSVGFRPAQGHP